jgi:FdhD protein
LRWNGASVAIETSDDIAAEEPLEIRVGGRPVSVTMRTPGEDLELAAGFLLTEGVAAIDRPPILRHEHPNVVNAAVTGVTERALANLNRNSFMASSCGLCGKASIESVHQHFPAVEDNIEVPRAMLLDMVDRTLEAQPGFARTGGVHAAAVFDRDGNLVIAREDVGRHNAVDKVVGHGLLRGSLPWSGHVLVVSGRASFEIVQKALAARIPVVAAVSAPSSLAVQFAEESGQTLIGFLRQGRFNVYTHVARVKP